MSQPSLRSIHEDSPLSRSQSSVSSTVTMSPLARFPMEPIDDSACALTPPKSAAMTTDLSLVVGGGAASGPPGGIDWDIGAIFDSTVGLIDTIPEAVKAVGRTAPTFRASYLQTSQSKAPAGSLSR
eukprot:1020390-Pyramimonas_sp.AAC.1